MLDHRHIQPFFRPTHARYLRLRDVPVRHDRRASFLYLEGQSLCLRLCPQPDRCRAAIRGGTRRSPLLPSIRTSVASRRYNLPISTLMYLKHRRFWRASPENQPFRWPFSVHQSGINFSCAHRRSRFLDRINIGPQIVAGDTGRRFDPQNIFSRQNISALQPLPHCRLRISAETGHFCLRSCFFYRPLKGAASF